MQLTLNCILLAFWAVGKWTAPLSFNKTENKMPIQKVWLYQGLILSILVDTFISKISLPMQPVPEIGSISGA